MAKRFVAIWFRYLKTDWYTRRIPGLAQVPFALSVQDHGRKLIAATNAIAAYRGIFPGMAVADARAVNPGLQVMDDRPDHEQRILSALAEWCIRYTPWVAVDMPDGLMLDATGCTHLWAGERAYITDIATRLHAFGYDVKIVIAGTIGAAWAFSRFGDNINIINPGQHPDALLSLPAAALRLDAEITGRLNRLGLRSIKDFIHMPRSALSRRFGPQLLQRINQALGHEDEIIQPVQPVEPYEARLPCMEPILTRTGIEIALQTLLTNLCERLKEEGKGLRNCIFKGFRTDGKVEVIEICTNRATHNEKHLFKLFEIKLDGFEPALGIEFFLLEAKKVEDVSPVQVKLWEQSSGLANNHLLELLDRFAGKFGNDCIKRYLPDEHYWPERSIKLAASVTENTQATWNLNRPRPIHLLAQPEPIHVTAPIPDYPPMNFRYKGTLHIIIKADGPERIEQEWWLQQGEHRDYYSVEDEQGRRFWVFRSGHYNAGKFSGWFLHGFFA